MDNPKFKFLTAGTPSGTGDYFSCSLGISCAQLKPAQNIFKKDIEGGTPYLTQFALTTTIHGDFLCTHMAFLAMLVTALVVASGGAALAIIIAWTALAGGVGLTMGLMCVFFGAMFRTWMLPKTNMFIGNPIPQNPVLSNSYMQCSAFGGIVTYNPKVTKWWQALLVLTSNTVLQVFSCIMIAAAAYTFATIAILATAGSGFLFIAKTILSNIAKNWLLSFTPVGGLVRIGATTNQIIQDQYVTPGDIPIEESVANGTQFYERGVISLFTGQIKMEQTLGLIALATPIKYPQNPLYENTGTEPIQQNQQQEIPNQPIQLSPEQLQKLHDQVNGLQRINKDTLAPPDINRLGDYRLTNIEQRLDANKAELRTIEAQLENPEISYTEIMILQEQLAKKQQALKDLLKNITNQNLGNNYELEPIVKQNLEIQSLRKKLIELEQKLNDTQSPIEALELKAEIIKRKLEIQQKEKEIIDENLTPEQFSADLQKIDELQSLIQQIKKELSNPTLTEKERLELESRRNYLQAQIIADEYRLDYIPKENGNLYTEAPNIEQWIKDINNIFSENEMTLTEHISQYQILVRSIIREMNNAKRFLLIAAKGLYNPANNNPYFKKILLKERNRMLEKARQQQQKFEQLQKIASENANKASPSDKKKIDDAIDKANAEYQNAVNQYLGD